MRALAAVNLALAVLLLAAQPSRASGGLWCSVDDERLKLSVETGMSHGMGGALFNFKASAELLDKQIAADFRKLTLDDKLVHHWVDRDETRLSFYTERSEGDFGSVDIIIETMGDREEGDIPGTYELAYFETSRQTSGDDGFIRFSGKVACGGE